MRLGRILLAAVLALSASPALAEVSDKIPSLADLWMWAGGFILAALMLALWRALVGLVVVPFAALRAWGGHAMVSDAHLGPAILQEQGEAYVRAVYASGAASVTGAALAVAFVMLWRLRAGTGAGD
ncbi:MAG: hypothetical protein KAF27_02015 [Porphyrobacter sp.]|nr:hypothetical protein [Porphyrobacter sp.]